MEIVITLITGLSTVTLVGITWHYAKTTNKILKESEINRKIQTFFSIYDDIHRTINNFRKTSSIWEEKKKSKNEKGEVIKESELIDVKGIESIRHIFKMFLKLYNGDLGYIPITLYSTPIYKNEKNRQVELIKKSMDTALTQLFSKLQYLFEFASDLDKDTKNTTYVKYACHSVDYSIKFIVAFLYAYDESFKFPNLIEKYKIIEDKEFDNIIEDPKFLQELYSKVLVSSENKTLKSNTANCLTKSRNEENGIVEGEGSLY